MKDRIIKPEMPAEEKGSKEDFVWEIRTDESDRDEMVWSVDPMEVADPAAAPFPTEAADSAAAPLSTGAANPAEAVDPAEAADLAVVPITEKGQAEEEAAEEEKAEDEAVSETKTSETGSGAESAEEIVTTEPAAEDAHGHAEEPADPDGIDSGKSDAQESRKKGQAPDWKMRISSMLAAAMLVLILFSFIFQITFPVDYDNLGGTHCWLSASTMIQVNNWLEDSPIELRFTNLGAPKSIETESVQDRVPYVSYPTGETFFVWAAARIAGVENVDIDFLKHLQQICYAIEAALLAIFVYMLLTGSGYRSESGKIAIAVMTAMLWILMPVNIWYLSNVYFADQCVILWVMMFLPVEYVIRLREKGGLLTADELSDMQVYERKRLLRNTSAGVLLYILRAVIIYTGMLIDYYFWILVFMAFLTEFLGDLFNRRGFQRAAGRSLGYVIPVVLALGTFFWQVCSVPGWFITLAARFRERTGDGAGFPEIRDFFRTAFAAGSDDHLRWMLIFHGVILVLSLIYILEHGGPGRLFRSSQCSILITAFGAVVFQIALLKQHSGVHEFSMIKVSWWIAMMAPVTAILILKVLSPRKEVTENGSNPLLSWLMVFFLLGYSGVLFITGIPSWDRPYYNYRNKVVQYPVAEAVRDNTEYTDVCFSFNSQIGLTPPMDLAVSGKQVWKVESLTDIETRFPGLRDRGARYLMVFDKAGEELTAEQKDLLDLFMTEPYIIYEDSSCVIAEIPDWNVGV